MVDPAVRNRLDVARADLRRTMAHAREALDSSRGRLSPTREELDQLQDDARSGRLGRDMQELARHVAAGDTSWQAVFDATSPYAELLRDHLTAMGNDHVAAVRRAIDDDPTFDPHETSAGV